MAVLGISIGTRRNGVAIVDGALQEAQVHSFNERWSREKISVILSVFQKYLHSYQISHVVIKIPKASHFTLALKQLITAVDAYVKSKGCMIQYLDIGMIKQSDPQITNKATLRQVVVDRYPELMFELRKEIRNKQPYYMKLFEAVVVSDIVHKRTEEQ